MTYEHSFAGVKLVTEPETFFTRVEVNGMSRRFTGIPFLRFKSGEEISFDKAVCRSSSVESGVSRGVRAVYSDFALPEELREAFGDLKAVMDTEILSDGFVRVSVRLENEPENGAAAIGLQPLEFNAPAKTGCTVLPRMQGILLPAQSYDTPQGGHYEGIIFERDAYMPMYGQITHAEGFGAGWGYAAIFDTPYDAKYIFDHAPGGDTVITPLFIASLGRMGYKRSMLYKFETNCDHTRIAKIYRGYLDERGRLKTLREKFVRTPAAEYLLGTPIVHTGIAVHISPDSHYYHKEEPEKNDSYTAFDERAKQLAALKEKGVERVYLHLDGWGAHGYDNLHPSPFPPNEAAGGAEGMKALSDTCRELGYRFGIHDQYRDYYYDAPDFDMENAVQNEDGSHPYCDIWYGGKHTWLCSKLAPEYVRHNYDQFSELGIRIDGTYLDVFSVVFLDECFNPAHRATREECAEARRACFELLNARNIITSSEEAVDCTVPSIVLCHHAPYFLEHENGEAKIAGVPIPLFNLVWHDCLVVPWSTEGDGWYLPPDYDALALAYINGGTAYLPVDADEEQIERLSGLLELHRLTGDRELVRHELVENDPKRQISVFDSPDGEITVYADFNTVPATVTVTPT